MALYEGFEKIKTICNNTTDDNEIEALFKLIGNRLYAKSLNAGKNIIKVWYNIYVHHNFTCLIVTISQLEDSSKSKLCQKCKINRVDDK